MTRVAEAGRTALILAALVLVNLPLIIVALVSLSPSPVFDLPHDGLSLRWYAKLLTLDDLWGPLATSLRIAALSTAISLVLGTACALGLTRGRFPAREAIATFVLSPMMLPGVVLGIALLFYLRGLGLTDAFAGLLIAHVVVTLPYVVRVTAAALSLFDFALLDAARTLGCSPPMAVVRVLLPAMAPSFVSASVFAFLASFDNYAIALFLGDVYTVTLPIQIIKYLSVATDPVVAAVSVMLLAGTLAALAVTERLIGLRRVAGL